MYLTKPSLSKLDTGTSTICIIQKVSLSRKANINHHRHYRPQLQEPRKCLHNCGVYTFIYCNSINFFFCVCLSRLFRSENISSLFSLSYHQHLNIQRLKIFCFSSFLTTIFRFCLSKCLCLHIV